MIDINELRQSLGAVQPEEVAELLDRLEAAEKERDALRAKIEVMERQEPVAWCATDETGTVIEALGMNQSRRFDTALYLAPSAQPAPSIPEGWKLAPIEVVDLYSFMCSAFTPMTPQQDQIAIQLDLAKRAMLTSSLGLVDQAMTRSAAIRARGEPGAP